MLPSTPTHEKWLRAMHRGNKRYQQGRPREAIKDYSRATKIAPARAESWGNLGALQVEVGDAEIALTALNKALRLKPDFVQVHLNLGDALRQLGKTEESIIAYAHALKLQRSPQSLNKMACAMRQVSRSNEAELLYREAIRLQDDFTIARVNLATVYVELRQFPKAAEQLQRLQQLQLPVSEQVEVASVQQALAEYQRIDPAIKTLLQGSNTALKDALDTTPREQLEVDPGIVAALSLYVASAKSLTIPHKNMQTMATRPDWAQIEALFMIPLVENSRAYRNEVRQLKSSRKLTIEQQESLNMVDVVITARSSRSEMSDPVLAEMHLRHWHTLACRELSDFLPGHFKISSNQTLRDPTIHRADPHLVAGSLRYFISSVYSQIEPGIQRALLCWMAVCDIHPFADGNGRIAMTWLNRELEWAGLTPCLFTRKQGITGELGQVMKQVRTSGDITLLLPVIEQAQLTAVDFCKQLD